VTIVVTLIYLDHAATTPLDPRVRAAMEPYLDSNYGNPSSIHRLGQQARMALDEARETVAAALSAHPSEIVFTSGGTESINTAIKGVAFASTRRGKHIVTSAIEHHAVLNTCAYLQARFGFEITRVPVDTEGFVDPTRVEAALRPDTVLVSIMYANNEIGTIQPVGAIGAICRAYGVPFHVDAVQAVGSIEVDVQRDNIDLLSLSAHKFYGPKGVGALFVRRGIPWWPQQHGGGQERERRSGTENVAGIVGMAVAINLAQAEMSTQNDRLAALRDCLFDGLLARVPDTHVNGSRTRRLSNNVNLSFAGVDGESLILALDMRGVLASSGSACASGSLEPSHVLQAIGLPDDLARGALRLTVGRGNTVEEIEEAIDIIVAVVERLRQAKRLAVGPQPLVV
jgi:cysteine desulfurase